VITWLPSGLLSEMAAATRAEWSPSPRRQRRRSPTATATTTAPRYVRARAAEAWRLSFGSSG